MKENNTRFVFDDMQNNLGVSVKGISEDFSLSGPRTLYGSTKLASELFITEYINTYKIKAVINRFGCIAGPWQMGKVDQGVMALWVSRHVYKKDLKYIGFGGKGKQVRDFLHIDDMFDIIDIQLESIEKCNGNIFNIGGGNDISCSLMELTKICEEVTGNKVNISTDGEDRPADLKIYISDNSKIEKIFNWKPKKNIKEIVVDTTDWIKGNETMLKNILE